MRYGGGPQVPVNVGDEIDVKVEAIGEKGDGIAKVKGFVLFIPDVKEGEEIKVRITKVLRKVGFAEKIGEASGPVTTEKPQMQVDDEPMPEPEPAPEDSEDFGEEPAEEETPAEDEVPEAPVEEEPAEEEKKEE